MGKKSLFFCFFLGCQSLSLAINLKTIWNPYGGHNQYVTDIDTTSFSSGGTGTQIQYKNGSSFGGVAGSTVGVTGPTFSSSTITTLNSPNILFPNSTLSTYGACGSLSQGNLTLGDIFGGGACTSASPGSILLLNGAGVPLSISPDVGITLAVGNALTFGDSSIQTSAGVSLVDILAGTHTWTGGNIYKSSSTFNGTINISSGVLLSGSAGSAGQFIQSNGVGTTPTWATAGGGSLYSTTGTWTAQQDHTSVSADTFTAVNVRTSFQVASDTLSVTSAGLGIGTNSPWASATILGAASAPTLTHNAASILGLYETTAGSQVAWTIDSAAPFTSSIQHRDNSNGANFPMAINPLGGNVGIGTANPSLGTFQIHNASLPAVMLSFENNGGSGSTWGASYGNEGVPNLYWGDTTAPTSKFFWRANYNTAGVAVNTFETVNSAGNSTTVVEFLRRNAGDTGDYFHITSNGGTTGNVLNVYNNGNVGIGVLVPASALHVVSPTTNAYEAQFSTSSVSFHVAVSTNGHTVTYGSAPTVSSCGASPSGSVVGDDNQGVITIGGTAPTACTLTFANSWGTGNMSCQLTNNSLTISEDISSLTTTTMTLGFGIGGLAGGLVYYRCSCSGPSCR